MAINHDKLRMISIHREDKGKHWTFPVPPHPRVLAKNWGKLSVFRKLLHNKHAIKRNTPTFQIPKSKIRPPQQVRPKSRYVSKYLVNGRLTPTFKKGGRVCLRFSILNEALYYTLQQITMRQDLVILFNLPT